MATILHLLFQTPSVPKLLVAASGSGNKFSPLLLLPTLILLFFSPYKPNPLYKGKWFAPMVDNPAYKGEWAPRKIANPDYFEDLTPVKSLNKIVRYVRRLLSFHVLTQVNRAVSVLSFGP
jgi:hypothetical protein